VVLLAAMGVALPSPALQRWFRHVVSLTIFLLLLLLLYLGARILGEWSLPSPAPGRTPETRLTEPKPLPKPSPLCLPFPRPPARLQAGDPVLHYGGTAAHPGTLGTRLSLEVHIGP
jgi:hypothetical protein